jgi:hypothetical protein
VTSLWRVRVVNNFFTFPLRAQNDQSNVDKEKYFIHLNYLLAYWRVLITFVLSFLFFHALAQSSTPPLERLVTVSFKQEQTDEVLKQISQLASCTFSYSIAAINTQKLVTGNFNHKTVREVLEVVFEGKIRYKQKNNYIILTKVASSDEVVVSGYIVDEATGQKLKQVSVYDPVSLRSSITDEFGFFELAVDKPTAEEVKLAINKRSYADTVVIVSTKRSSFQNISLNIDKDKWKVVGDSLDRKINRVWLWTKQSVQRINMRNIRDTLQRTWQVSFVPFIGTNHTLSGNVINNYSINILGGYSAGTRKAEFGGLFNIDRGDVSFAQFAGLFNLNGGKIQGAQFAGLFNTNLDSANAAQFAGLLNFNRRTSQGGQFSGLINGVVGSYKGAQLAGLFNFVTHNIEGAQVAGLFNTNFHAVDGAQIAGVFNVNTKEVKGVQVAGLLNVANKVYGTQVGFLNIADTVSGAPIGFLSFVNKGYHKIELAADDVFPINVSFRTGVRKFYNIITAGIRPENTDTVTWSFGYGIGTAPKLSENIFLNIDVTANEVLKGNIDKLNLINKLYLGIDYQIAKRFSITAGATLNLRIYNANFSNHAKLFSYYKPSIFSDGEFTSTTNYQMWWGAKVGLRFL